ncbi:MAG: FkbM family methyltransferase [Deltaproteobacteria bacterium]|nr:FkbM family methyltransferase [Deltaproteobacteria bacterium]
MKKLVRRLIGDENYLKTFGYISDIYQSVFLKIKEEGTAMVPNFIQKGDTVFDIGANVGRFTSLAAALAGPKGRVYSFEPQQYPRKILTQMKSVRSLSQVIIVDKALSDSPGTAEITIPLKDGWKPKSACGHLDGENEDPHKTETVGVSTLDAFCEENGVGRLDFIKCDVEGAELKVFRAGTRVLTRFHPTIYCEVDKLCCDRNKVPLRAVFDFLESLGYRAYLPDKSKKLFYVDPGNIPREKTEYFFIHVNRKESFPAELFR